MLFQKQRVCYAIEFERFLAVYACAACTAWFVAAFVAAPCEFVRYAELEAELYYSGFVHVYERGFYRELFAASYLYCVSHSVVEGFAAVRIRVACGVVAVGAVVYDAAAF